jgi:hypothetical protein
VCASVWYFAGWLWVMGTEGMEGARWISTNTRVVKKSRGRRREPAPVCLERIGRLKRDALERAALDAQGVLRGSLTT